MRHTLNYIRQYPGAFFLIILPAFIIHMLVIMPSGSYLCLEGKCGYFFWGANAHDGIWHLAIAAVSFNKFPFIVPTYAGASLSGYNIFMDFILYLLSKIGISPFISYFKIIPPIWFFVFSWILIIFSRKIHNSTNFIFFTLFFIFFAGHFGYLLSFYHNGSIVGGTQSFAIQSATSLLNLQFALSLPLIVCLFILVQQNKFDLSISLKIGVVSAILLGLKFYTSAVVLVVAGGFLLESFIHNKSLVYLLKQVVLIILPVLLIIFLFYNPTEASKSGSILKFAPFATIHAIIEEKNMVYLPEMVLARYYLYAHGIGPRLLFIELFSTLLYIFFNFGVRFFGLVYFLVLFFRRKTTRLSAYLLLTTLFTITATTLFIQKGDWWNTVQFMYYGIFLSNFFVAEMVFQLWNKRKILYWVLVFLIMLIAVPMNIDVIYGFTKPDAAYHISQKEVEALKFLQQQPNGVVFSSFERDLSKVYNFYDYKSAGYIPAFTNKQLYFGQIGPLTKLGIDYHQRKQLIDSYDCRVFREIDYIYYLNVNDSSYLQHCSQTIEKNFKPIFNNKLVFIYQRRLDDARRTN